YPVPGVPGTSGACPERPGRRPGGTGGSARLGRLASEARFAGTHDRLGSIGDAELVEDVRDVVADRLVADAEPGPDLGVRAALGDQLEDLVLAVGELRKRRGRRRPGRGEEGLELRGDPLAEDHLADGRR